MTNTSDHLTEEMLEQYVQGRLSVKQAAEISEHLFECDACSTRYDQEVDLFTGIRTVAPQLEAEPKRAPWWQIAAWPSPVWAGAAALVLLLAIFPKLTPTGAPVVAELSAVRSDATVRAPANRPIELRLDATGAESAQKVRTEVVDSTGNTVWTGEAEMKNGRWETALNRGFKAGNYWVRVYGTSGAEAIREYSLLLENK